MALVAGSAMAGPLVTFTYTNLNGIYTDAGNGTGTFNALAANLAALKTDGSVSRVVGPGAGTAVFNPGFFGGSAADFVLTLSVFNKNNMFGTAQGAGHFTITDTLGNKLDGDLTGDWINFGGATFFNGAISNSFFTPVVNGGFFGNTGAFLTNVPGQPLDGSLVQLFLDASGFFDSSFREVSTGVAGQLVPSPASTALIALGGLIATRRRR
ncbi:MAG: hypothetical protein U0570_09645 [Phycisphaerales bacterium]